MSGDDTDTIDLGHNPGRLPDPLPNYFQPHLHQHYTPSFQFVANPNLLPNINLSDSYPLYHGNFPVTFYDIESKLSFKTTQSSSDEEDSLEDSSETKLTSKDQISNRSEANDKIYSIPLDESAARPMASQQNSKKEPTSRDLIVKYISKAKNKKQILRKIQGKQKEFEKLIQKQKEDFQREQIRSQKAIRDRDIKFQKQKELLKEKLESTQNKMVQELTNQSIQEKNLLRKEEEKSFEISSKTRKVQFEKATKATKKKQKIDNSSSLKSITNEFDSDIQLKSQNTFTYDKTQIKLIKSTKKIELKIIEKLAEIDADIENQFTSISYGVQLHKSIYLHSLAVTTILFKADKKSISKIHNDLFSEFLRYGTNYEEIFSQFQQFELLELQNLIDFQSQQLEMRFKEESKHQDYLLSLIRALLLKNSTPSVVDNQISQLNRSLSEELMELQQTQKNLLDQQTKIHVDSLTVTQKRNICDFQLVQLKYGLEKSVDLHEKLMKNYNSYKQKVTAILEDNAASFKKNIAAEFDKLFEILCVHQHNAQKSLPRDAKYYEDERDRLFHVIEDHFLENKKKIQDMQNQLNQEIDTFLSDEKTDWENKFKTKENQMKVANEKEVQGIEDKIKNLQNVLDTLPPVTNILNDTK